MLKWFHIFVARVIVKENSMRLNMIERPLCLAAYTLAISLPHARL